MKKLFFASLAALSMAALFSSCNNEQMPLMDGSYVGKYTMTYPSGDTQIWDVTLTLDGNEFALSDGDDTTIPAHGSIDCTGKFSTREGKLIFESDPQIVLALYLILPSLGGECDYTFDGKQLDISKVPQEDEGYYGCTFDWNLIKQ